MVGLIKRLVLIFNMTDQYLNATSLSTPKGPTVMKHKLHLEYISTLNDKMRYFKRF